ncbi:hypothetical protein E2C06_31310 [Dankookia rubra]|uniref:Uncharacterized protein n=1 Tax=Dankookia rubra TaxID=1442381 RepID=A0A4R5Q963_9PROT|nr:hypothetical protein E2C06_31310 [Dankookia rubra]
MTQAFWLTPGRQPHSESCSPVSQSVMVDHVVCPLRPSRKKTSEPAPPVRKFEPRPPSRTSSPLPPFAASSPPRRLMKSLLAVPITTSLSAVPRCWYCRCCTGPL